MNRHTELSLHAIRKLSDQTVAVSDKIVDTPSGLTTSLTQLRIYIYIYRSGNNK